ncbi:MAG: hypothetical protein CMJ89_01475 [Planctomycetes bacterium]|jgi:hypothetical protein|nr:hypothetical protein [Planctomycetota bacterium]
MKYLSRILLSTLALVGVEVSVGFADTWRIIVLPDTQNYVNLDNDFDMNGTSDYLHHFQTQIDWIVANKDALNIIFVSHCGDIVEHVEVVPPALEWMDADQVMSGLDGILPYGAVAGNHDILNTGVFPFNYVTFFGPARYASYPWYGGASTNGLNHYQKFQVRGSYGLYRFTNISMQWQLPGNVNDPSTPMGWVQRVIDRESPLSNILLTTHATIDVNGQFGSETFGLVDENTPEEVRDELLRPNRRALDLVFSAHYHLPTDGAALNFIGNRPVMLSNYQDFPEGGTGYLRIVEFIEGGGMTSPDLIQIRTYSPSLDQYLLDADNEFSFEMDFASSLNPQPDPTPIGGGRGITKP